MIVRNPRPGVARMRRLRSTPALRSLRRETVLSGRDLIAPVFVVERDRDAGPIESMPGVRRHALAELPDVAGEVFEAGVPAVLLFGIPGVKDHSGTPAWDEGGIVPRAVAAIKATRPELAVITDVCLCQYTDHGHCGLLGPGGEVLNDETLERLGRVAVAHAAAGADVVAPSGMLDGMVRAIRSCLDDAGRTSTAILSYSVKYASAFYGPFRDAAGSTPASGDRRSHQMDPANAREALAEARLDVEEGADALMVKPAGPCLDVIRRIRDRFEESLIVAYQVSGEYAMIAAAADRGWLDERAARLESLTAIRRAGADRIITYDAPRVARWLRESGEHM